MPSLTERDLRLLETLTLRVRLLSLDQVAAHFWNVTPGGLANARRRLVRLADVGLVDVTHVHSRPILDLSAPVLEWSPGGPSPDFAAVAWRLQSRWTDSPNLTPVVVPTSKTACRFGGAGGRLRRFQAEHDLHVAALYLRALTHDPEAAHHWLNEDLRPKAGYGQKDPDVLIDFPNGRETLVMEFGGHYDETRLREFHADCQIKHRRYTIW